MIKTILIFLVLSSNAFAFGLLNQMDAGSTPSAGTCDCTDNKVNEDQLSLGCYTGGISVSQSFVASGTGTNVVVRFRVGFENEPSDGYTIRLDSDRNFSAGLYGSVTGQPISSSPGEHCAVITSSTELSASSTYYFLITGDDPDSGDRFFLNTNSGDYTGGTMCTKGSSDLDHTSGTTCASDVDLYFEVCVGAGCSCP